MRRLLLLVSTIVLVDAMLFGCLAPLIPGYAEEFGLSKTGAGLLVGSFGAGALFGGIPGGLAAARFGPKSAVVVGLVLLAVASFGFAAADGPWTLGLARFVQGLSSTTTWAGALAWLTVAGPRERRGELLGTAFGAAVFGAIVGPMFGALAEEISIRGTFTVVGLMALALAGWAASRPHAPAEEQTPAAIPRALRDPGFLGGLWLNALPALLFGVIVVLVPLRLDTNGWSTLAIGAVFLFAGLLETAVNPILGRFSDRRGRLLPIRVALATSVAVAIAFAFVRDPVSVTVVAVLAAVAFGGFYTPGMALVSDRAEIVGLSQGLGFGIMNTAWALGNMTGPSAGGALAEAGGDGVPYAAAAILCALTLVASYRVRRPGRETARAPSEHRADPSRSALR
ncbi:MAG: MFS transporter [Actinobacteria bacterium]|nr:MFS transporter [Actinomycetota bacterium]